MKSLYVSYDGLLDPLGQSQVLPYVRRLRAAGHEFTILSCEKNRPAAEVEALERDLSAQGIAWRRLPFKHGAGGFLLRLATGARWIRKLVREVGPDIVHLRGFVPALMNALCRHGRPHIYDFRSFAVEEWAECGKISGRSLAYRIFRRLDHRAVSTAAGLVVLEEPAAELLRRTYRLRTGVPLQIIRTSTDVTRYPRREAPLPGGGAERLRFVCLGGARFPYRPDLALRLVRGLQARGIAASIHFVNEGDHEPLARAVTAAGVAPEQVKIFAAKHAEVPQLLGNYDCGLFFCETSPWRRVCSPTKLGEYLGAGLPVIALPGIDVIDRYAVTTPCVTTIDAAELTCGLDETTAARVSAFIRSADVARQCQELARRDFDLSIAGDRYVALYEDTQRFVAVAAA
jgi:hypothetical protein